MSKPESIFTDIVPGGLCVGCGMCAAVSPGDLEMRLLPEGRFEPRQGSGAQAGRWEGASLAVCPFADNGENEDSLGRALFSGTDGICHTSETGYFLACYSGHVTDENDRIASTSGGLITWMLGDLLRDEAVSAVVCVGPEAPGSDNLFGYRIVRSREELAACRKSRYYPIEVSQVIPLIKDEPGRVVFVGLPCFLKALRLAAKTDQVLADKIGFTVGLFCGHLKTRQFGEYLSRLCGVRESEAVTCDFRHKVAGQPANKYAFEVATRRDGAESRKRIMMSDVYAGGWSYTTFMLKACECCDDVLAELADLSIGDAWLPEFTNDYRGTSLAVCRDPELCRRLEAGAGRGELKLDTLKPEAVIRSQSGGFRARRPGLAYRLHHARGSGQWRPVKRVSPDAGALSLFYRLVQRIRMKIREKSIEAFLAQGATEGVGIFTRRIRFWIRLHDSIFGIRGRLGLLKQAVIRRSK